MELALSLGDTPKPFSFLEKSGKDLGFCMALGANNNGGLSKETGSEGERRDCSSDPPVQLDLLPFSPVHRNHQPQPKKYPFPWLNEKLGSDSRKGDEADTNPAERPTLSSPNSTVSSFHMDFSMLRSSNINARISGKNDHNFDQIITANYENEGDRGASSRGSDEEENGSARKKLRLSKEQSAFLEESFKEHNTLNPKQKLALAKQLNLRPRQVEVWFQNRRARTKLKQTEVDCEYLKRCCETLTEENRRLQKELQELRALKASQPFYMQLPATTLTMCPSCERVATTTAPAGATKAAAGSKLFSLSTNSHVHAQQAAS